MADENKPVKLPLDEALMPVEQPAEIALIELDERHMEYARLRWPEASEKMRAYRVRQAIWAKFEHDKPHPDDPDRRNFGGPQPGSGKRVQKRIGEALVAAGQERIKEVVDAAFSALAPGNDPRVRHKAAINLAKLEQDERKLDIVEDEYARRTDEDIQREAAGLFAKMVREGSIPLDDLVVDATVVDEDEPARLSA